MIAMFPAVNPSINRETYNQPAEFASGPFRVRPKNEIAQLLQQPFLVPFASGTRIDAGPKFAQSRL